MGSTYLHKQTRHNETVFEKVRRIVINNGRSHHHRNMTQYFLSTPKRTQNFRSRTVQTPGERENPKTISRNCRTFEETFLDGCLKSITTCHHMQNQSRRLKRRNAHGFLLKRQPPACQRVLVATKDTVSGREDRRHPADDAWARQQKKKKSKPSKKI